MPFEIHNEGEARRRSHRVLSPVLRIALLLGVAVHFAGFLFFRVVSNPLPSPSGRGPFVQFVSPESLTGDAEFEERAALFDSAPLFLPTQWSSVRGVRLKGSGFVPPGFAQFEPEINVLRDLDLGALAGLESYTVEEPIDLLASRYWRFFQHFGEAPAPDFSFGDAELFAEVEVVAGEGVAATSTLASAPVKFEIPPAARPFGPVHLLVRLLGGGYAATTPLIERSSGSVDFDRAVVIWLEASTLIGELSEGYYRIKIYPN